MTDGLGITCTSMMATNLVETGLFLWQRVYYPRLQGPTVTVRLWTAQNTTYPTHFIIDDVTLRPY